MGWSAGDVVVGLAQGYDQLSLYKDVFLLCSSPNSRGSPPVSVRHPRRARESNRSDGHGHGALPAPLLLPSEHCCPFCLAESGDPHARFRVPHLAPARAQEQSKDRRRVRFATAQHPALPRVPPMPRLDSPQSGPDPPPKRGVRLLCARAVFEN
jgi:hypothetical protein